MRDISAMKELKDAFYAFCECLSLDEIASNPLLLQFVEILEKELYLEQTKVA
ncbi:MAG: hypothetical protein KA715_00265 [Xanthomonadaceae bacterium]|nr:hypothetical protein [Xanthomonadaceae bacterium]